MNYHKYFLFNKPKGMLGSLSNPQGQRNMKNCINMLMHDTLYTMDSLDYNTQGAMLLTSNGMMSYKLMHPSFKIHKRYIIKVMGLPSDFSINFLKKKYREIISIDNIGITKGKNTWLNIEVYTGRTQSLLNMFWHINFPISKIIRTSFAGIGLSCLKPGNVRALTNKEILTLYSKIDI